MISPTAVLSAFQVAPAADGRLTFSEVVADLPTDPASIFVVVLLIVSFGAIFWIGRPRRPSPPTGPA